MLRYVPVDSVINTNLYKLRADNTCRLYKSVHNSKKKPEKCRMLIQIDALHDTGIL